MPPLALSGLGLLICARAEAQSTGAPPAFSCETGSHPDAWSAGAHLIPITTPKGNFHVWVKRVGNNPKLKLLLLHGGPGATHEYFEAFDSYFPKEGIEYYYYDQLGSAFRGQAKDPG